MSHPDFEAMTIEEIEAYRIEKRDAMRELRADIIASKEVYERKLSLRYLGAQMRQVGLEHLTGDDAKALMDIIRRAPRAGDVTVAPDTNDELELEGSDVEVI